MNPLSQIYIYIQPLSHACPHSLTGRKGLHHQRQQPNEPTSIVVPSTLLPDSGPSSPTDHDNRHFIPSFPSYDDHVGLKAIQNPPGTKKNLATGKARGAEGRSQEGRGDYRPEAVVKNGKAAIAAIASVSVPAAAAETISSPILDAPPTLHHAAARTAVAVSPPVGGANKLQPRRRRLIQRTEDDDDDQIVSAATTSFEAVQQRADQSVREHLSARQDSVHTPPERAREDSPPAVLTERAYSVRRQRSLGDSLEAAAEGDELASCTLAQKHGAINVARILPLTSTLDFGNSGPVSPADITVSKPSVNDGSHSPVLQATSRTSSRELFGESIRSPARSKDETMPRDGASVKSASSNAGASAVSDTRRAIRKRTWHPG